MDVGVRRVSVANAVRTGSEVEALEAMRDALADAMDDAGPAVVAQVSGQLLAVLRRLSEVQPARGVTIEDALAARRESRGAMSVTDGGSARKAKPAS